MTSKRGWDETGVKSSPYNFWEQEDRGKELQEKQKNQETQETQENGENQENEEDLEKDENEENQENDDTVVDDDEVSVVHYSQTRDVYPSWKH